MDPLIVFKSRKIETALGISYWRATHNSRQGRSPLDRSAAPATIYTRACTATVAAGSCLVLDCNLKWRARVRNKLTNPTYSVFQRSSDHPTFIHSFIWGSHDYGDLFFLFDDGVTRERIRRSWCRGYCKGREPRRLAGHGTMVRVVLLHAGKSAQGWPCG